MAYSDKEVLIKNESNIKITTSNFNSVNPFLKNNKKTKKSK